MNIATIKHLLGGSYNSPIGNPPITEPTSLLPASFIAVSKKFMYTHSLGISPRLLRQYLIGYVVSADTEIVSFLVELLSEINNT